MNELRNPTSLLAGTNIVFSVGSFMFLYKRMEQLQNDNLELKKTMQSLTTNYLRNDEVTKQQNELMGKVFKDIKNLKEDKDILPDELKAILLALEANDIEVDLPKKKSHKKKKYVSSEESSEEETPKRKNKKKTKEELGDEDIINLMRKQRSY